MLCFSWYKVRGGNLHNGKAKRAVPPYSFNLVMKHFYLKTILSCVLSVAGITVSAYDCKVNGIYYKLNKDNQTASVTYYSDIVSDNRYGYFGSVNIPSSFTLNDIIYSVTSIDSYAFSGCRDIYSVSIPNSVTSIGGYAFSSCSNLTSVSIPNSMTSIDSYAFTSCSGLTSVSIPNSVTSIGSHAFSGCSGLTSVSIPNSVTSIGSYAFTSCSGLTSITIPNSVTSIGSYAFNGCI